MEIDQLETYTQKNNQKDHTHRNNINQINHHQDSWIFKLTDAYSQNQISLQQKIVKMYQLIQQKTAKNVQKSKNNQILKVQVEVYETIINKIENAAKLQQKQRKGNERKEDDKLNHNMNLQCLVKKDNADGFSHNQSQRNEENIDIEDSYQKYLKSKKKQSKVNDENEEQNGSNNESSRNLQLYQNNSSKYEFKKNHHHRFSTITDNQNEINWKQFISNKQIEKNMGREKTQRMNKFEMDFGKLKEFTKKQNQFNQKMKERKKNTEGRNFQKCTPRISIDRSIGLNSINGGKSYLKKERTQNTRNFGHRYSVVDIEHLWNGVQGIQMNQGYNITKINKEAKKQNMKGCNQINNGRINSKKIINK